MPILKVPEPYDFELSLERFFNWGLDRANVWHAGGLHRVVDGREVRIERARGGVRIDPLDDAIEPVVRKLLGLELDLAGFQAFSQTDPVLSGRLNRVTQMLDHPSELSRPGTLFRALRLGLFGARSRVGATD